jgi:hypothetical protein
MLVCSGQAIGQQSASPFPDSRMTVAGELEIIPLDETCKFNVALGGKVILTTDCEVESNPWASTPIPTIHSHHKTKVSPFDEVVLLQMNMLGNACDGGPLLFLGLKKDQTYAWSEPIDFCGGKAPVVTWGSSRVTVRIPGGPPNRGSGYIPGETWVYQNGAVKKVKSSPKRR